MDIEKLRDQLKIDEGCVNSVYLDHLNLPTVGIGHLVTDLLLCIFLSMHHLGILLHPCMNAYNNPNDMRIQRSPGELG